MSGTGYPDTGVETDDLDVLAFKVSSFSSAISFNLSYKYRFLSPRMNMDTGYSKDTTVAPIIYKVKVWVSSTGGLLMKLTKKQTPEHMVNKIQQTISIFLFIISYHNCTKVTTDFYEIIRLFDAILRDLSTKSYKKVTKNRTKNLEVIKNHVRFCIGVTA